MKMPLLLMQSDHIVYFDIGGIYIDWGTCSNELEGAILPLLHVDNFKMEKYIIHSSRITLHYRFFQSLTL
jgi:hypothetical protein